MSRQLSSALDLLNAELEEITAPTTLREDSWWVLPLFASEE